MIFGGLRRSMRMAQWVSDLRAEQEAHIQWVNDELNRRMGEHNPHVMSWLPMGLFTGSVMPTAHITTMRAIRDRIEYGDEVSIGTINSIVNFMKPDNDGDRELVDISLRCAPLVLPSLISEHEVKFAVNGVEKYHELFDELNTNEDWRENSKAVVQATLHAYLHLGSDAITIENNEKGLWESFSLSSIDTVRLIISHKDKLEDIMRVMKDRMTIDSEVIASVLDTDAKALSQGIL